MNNNNAETKLDVKDRKILALLDTDARLPVSVIAKRVGLSREVVNYRINQLEKKGIIEGYYTVLDVSKLGLMYCRVFLKYRHMSKEKEKELLDYCRKNKKITWIAVGDGRWDITLVLVVKSLSEIEKTCDELNSLFGLYIQDPYASIAFKIYHLPHNYLHNSRETKEAVLGQTNAYDENELPKIDKTDIELLNALSENASESLVSLAKKLSTTPKLINYRMKKLIKEKVILSFRAKINTRLLGYSHYKIFLNLQKLSEANLNRIIAYLKNSPNVIYITKPMGTYNLEFEIMLKGTNELYEFMRELSFNFSDIIVNHETILYYSEPMLKYL